MTLFWKETKSETIRSAQPHARAQNYVNLGVKGVVLAAKKTSENKCKDNGGVCVGGGDFFRFASLPICTYNSSIL